MFSENWFIFNILYEKLLLNMWTLIRSYLLSISQLNDMKYSSKDARLTEFLFSPKITDARDYRKVKNFINRRIFKVGNNYYSFN